MNLYSFQDGADGRLPDTTLVLAVARLRNDAGDFTLGGAANYGTVSASRPTEAILRFLALSPLLLCFTRSRAAMALTPATACLVWQRVLGHSDHGIWHDFRRRLKQLWGRVFGEHRWHRVHQSLSIHREHRRQIPSNRPMISAGTLYGTTTNSVFKINTDGSGFTPIATIDGASQLILSMSGYTFYEPSNGGTRYGPSLASIPMAAVSQTSIALQAAPMAHTPVLVWNFMALAISCIGTRVMHPLWNHRRRGRAWFWDGI